jgi:N-methylhydantoinase B
VRLLRYAIHRDSGGPGRYRGGAGVVREYHVLAEHAVLSTRIDSVVKPPWGVAGGMQGGTGRAVVNHGTPHERKLAPLSDGTVLRRGDILLLETGGGGGHGHPFDRPAEHVLRDCHDGFVSIEAARRDYGVVITGDTVDHAATVALRATRPSAKAFHRKGYVDAIG